MKHWIIYYPTPKVSPISRPVCLSRGGWTSQEPEPLTEQEMRLLEEAFTGLGTILELLERSSTRGPSFHTSAGASILMP